MRTSSSSVDRQRVARIVENVEGFTQSFAQNKQNIDNIFQDVATLAGRLNDTAPKLDAALTDFSKVAGAIDPAKLGRTSTTPTFLDRARQFEQGRREGGPSRRASITEKLNKSADRIDGVLKAAENFLGSASGEEGKGAFASVRQAADSIRTLADNLDKRTAEITTGLTRFTGSGLRDGRGGHGRGAPDARTMSAARCAASSAIHSSSSSAAARRSPNTTADAKLMPVRPRSALPLLAGQVDCRALGPRLFGARARGASRARGAACSSGPPPTTFDLTAPRQKVRGGVGRGPGRRGRAGRHPGARGRTHPRQGRGQRGFVPRRRAMGRPAAAPDPGAADPDLRERARASRRSAGRATGSPPTTCSTPRSGRSRSMPRPARRWSRSRPRLVDDRAGRIANARVFTARVPVAAVDAGNAAQALDRALSIVLLDIVRWVGTGHA